MPTVESHHEVAPRIDDWALVRAGDDQALAVLFARHKDFVFRLACGLTANPSLAEDVTQEVFLRVLTARRRWRPRAQFRTLLYRVTANTARELARRGQREMTGHDALTNDQQATEQPPVGELRALFTALDDLPTRQREVVVLRHLEGLSTRETAAALGCRSGTVKAHLHRAFAALRGILNPDSVPHQSSTPTSTGRSVSTKEFV